MNADRELDALIAEKVMGFQPIRVLAGTAAEKTLYVEPGRRPSAWNGAPAQPYSTDIAAAFLVAEHITQKHVVPLQLVCYGYARTYAKLAKDFDADEGWSEANGEHATPLAICLAALAAVEAER